MPHDTSQPPCDTSQPPCDTIQPPCVLAIDIGTSSVRAILFDRTARIASPVFQKTYDMATTPDGGVHIDADRMVAVVSSVLDDFCAWDGHNGGGPATGGHGAAGRDRDGPAAGGHTASGSTAIDGVAMTTFWHNVVGVEGDRAVTPLISWADTRPGTVIPELMERLDVGATHMRTGCVLHASYLPAKILWFARSDPDTFARVERWMSIGEYLFLKWFGAPACSVSMASGTGLFNANRCDWDDETLAALPLERDHLTPLTDVDEPVRGLKDVFASRWPVLAGASWYPAIGDGACNNIGSGCVDEDRIALMVGTSGAMRVMRPAAEFSIPEGLWCYRSDRRRILMGGALSNGGNVYGWMHDTLRLADEQRVERDLGGMTPDGHGLTVLPFWAGERSPGWHDAARAAITGMTLHTTPLDVMRASLEATAYCFANIHDRLRSIWGDTGEIVASGAGLLQSPVWMQMLADVLQRPITASTVTEASSRGAALLALEASGELEDLAAAPAPLGKTYEPDPANRDRYREAMKRQQNLYDMMMDS